MNWTITHSPKSGKNNYPSSNLTEDAYRELLDRGIDEVAKEVFAEPFQGEAFVRFENTKRDYGKKHSYRGYSGVVPMNSDSDTLPFASKGIGFDWDWQTYGFRVAIGMDRKAIEIDDVGFTKDGQRDMLEMHKRTVEYVIADHFNRAFGTSGAPRLSDDGCYYVSSARPNPNASAGTWSNLEATADLDEDTLFTASFNASQQVSPDGNLFPQKIKKMMIPPGWLKKMWTLLSTEKVLGSNHNDANWAAGAFSMEDVIVYDYLQTDAIFYWLADPKSQDNQLVLFKRVEPNVMTEWGMLGNPDVLNQRLRADWGLGLGSPRKSIRGGLLSAQS
jgi:hypothetical protein